MKKTLNLILVIFLALYVLLIVLYKTSVISYAFLNASFYSGVINILNVLASLLAFNYSMNRSNKIFLIFNVGGMILRMFLLLAIILILLKFLNIDKYGFIFNFFILYIVFLAIEVNYFRLKISQKKT